MATEQLIIELDARTKKLEARLDATEHKLKGVSSATTKADQRFEQFTASAKRAAVAVTAVATAVGLAVNQANQFAIQLERASRRAGETVERMQALSFATATVGIDLEKLGDISKDTNEKIGEFLATGGGGFQDFADVMGLSAQEAREAAEQFELLSGPDVLQAMVEQMEAAGVSSEQMSFALEGLASDSTDLIRLFKDGGKELDELTSGFEEMNITLTETDLEKIKDVGAQFDLMGTYFGNQAKKLIADYSEELIGAIQMIVTLAQKTTQTFDVITSGLGGLFEVTKAAINDFKNDTNELSAVLAENAEESRKAWYALLGYDENGDPLEPLTIKITKGQKEQTEETEKGGKKRTAAEKKEYERRLDSARGFFAAGMALNEHFFNDNKAVAAGLIIADTAAAIMKSLSVAPYDWGNVAFIAATGAIQLSKALSAQKGGGSVSSDIGSGPSGGSSAGPTDQEFSTLDLESQATDAQGVGASNDIRIVFSTEDSDELLEVIANLLEQRQRRGG